MFRNIFWGVLFQEPEEDVERHWNEAVIWI